MAILKLKHFWFWKAVATIWEIGTFRELLLEIHATFTNPRKILTLNNEIEVENHGKQRKLAI